MSAALVFALVGCNDADRTVAPEPPEVEAPTAPIASQVNLAVAPAPGTLDVRPDADVVVSAAGGALTSVTVRAADGSVLPGAYDATKSTWTAAVDRLPFQTTYSVEATGVDAAGRGKVTYGGFTTLTPIGTLKTRIAPLDGETVGIGMPVIVSLTNRPANRAAVEAALTVEATPAVEGSWAWMSGTELHWRPRDFWAPGTTVTVRTALIGVDAGEGIWGGEERSISFNIGAARVHTVDIASHQMTVTENGAVVRTIPITTGEPGYDTRSGTKVIMSKERNRIMDSATVDIPAGSPDAYRLNVEYAMRVTNSGEFIHAAPWSVGSQGVRNVSHGCTGMSTANAAWFYDFTRKGDVVRYVNANRGGVELGNGWADWNLSWDNWTGRSAL